MPTRTHPMGSINSIPLGTTSPECVRQKALAASPSPHTTLPNELSLHLKSVNDLNSLVWTSRFFHTLFNDLLYHRAVTTDDTVRGDMVKVVLLRSLVTSLKLVIDHGLCLHQKLGQHWEDDSMLHFLCTHGDDERSVPLARLLIERGADIEAKDPKNAETMLHVAARKGACGLAELLLEHGADVNAADKHGLIYCTTPCKLSRQRRDGELANCAWCHCGCTR
jgi:hypothetical protein